MSTYDGNGGFLGSGGNFSNESDTITVGLAGEPIPGFHQYKFVFSAQNTFSGVTS